MSGLRKFTTRRPNIKKIKIFLTGLRSAVELHQGNCSANFPNFGRKHFITNAFHKRSANRPQISFHMLCQHTSSIDRLKIVSQIEVHVEPCYNPVNEQTFERQNNC